MADLECGGMAENGDRPAARLNDLQDHADARRLSRPIRSKEAADRPRRQIKAEIIDGLEAAIKLRDLPQFEGCAVYALAGLMRLQVEHWRLWKFQTATSKLQRSSKDQAPNIPH